MFERRSDLVRLLAVAEAERIVTAADRLPDLTAGIVAASGHPLHAAGPEPRDLAGWPWIDFDEPGDAAAGRPSLATILHELRGLTGRPVRAVLRAGSAGLGRPHAAGGRPVARLAAARPDARSPAPRPAARLRPPPLPHRLPRPALGRGPGAVPRPRTGRARRCPRAQRRAARIGPLPGAFPAGRLHPGMAGTAPAF